MMTCTAAAHGKSWLCVSQRGSRWPPVEAVEGDLGMSAVPLRWEGAHHQRIKDGPFTTLRDSGRGMSSTARKAVAVPDCRG